jgi:hypothetical protein
MVADKKLSLKPPPPLGGRTTAPAPGTTPDAGTPPSAGGPPRVAVGAAPTASSSGSGATVKTPSAPSVVSPSVAPPSVAARPASAPSSPGPKAPVRARPTGAAPKTARAVRKTGGELAPGATVRDLRRPTGTVKSNAQVAEILRAGHAVADVLEQENAALRRHDTDTVKTLTERKEATTSLYRERMLAMHKDPSIITTLPEDDRAVVRAFGQYLDAHLAENARLLKSAMESTNRLMGVIVDAMKGANGERAPGYAQDARLTDAAHNPARVSLTYNENL